MSESRYASLEDVIRDPVFPAVDVALRRGRHVDQDDADWYGLLVDAQDHLESFYRRYGCELVRQADGYFFLLPTGHQLGRRRLSVGEMLVGQALALLYLDPTMIASGGRVERALLLSRLAGLVGEEPLVRALNPRRKRIDERIAQETVRTEVGKALRGLARLGFVELVDEVHIRMRAPLLRFADPVRGLEDLPAALERLVVEGRIALGDAEPEQADDDLDGSERDEDEDEDEADETDDDEDQDSSVTEDGE